jgi:hypothetical protein
MFAFLNAKYFGDKVDVGAVAQLQQLQSSTQSLKSLQVTRVSSITCQGPFRPPQ